MLVYIFGSRCPHLAVEYTLVIPVYEAILTLIVLASFANASIKDPGIIPRGRAIPKHFIYEANPELRYLRYFSILVTTTPIRTYEWKFNIDPKDNR